MKTVLEVIRATTAYFRKHDIENPRLNIEHLLAHVLGKRRMDLYLEFDRTLSEQELTPLRELVKRRSLREPLQHLLGTVEFCGRTFASDRRALIPRPETEQLCELIQADLKDGRMAIGRMLDVGTGSGVIAITLALWIPTAKILAVDVSKEALTLARENSLRHGTNERLQIQESDLFAQVNGQFALVVANLPYIDSREVKSLSPEVRCDPVQALDGGAAGLEIFNRFIAEAKAHLRGHLALEIGSDQGEALTNTLAAHNYQDIRVMPDYQGRDRFVFATYG